MARTDGGFSALWLASVAAIVGLNAECEGDPDADPRTMTRRGYLTALPFANLLELALVFWLVPGPWMVVAIVIVAGAAGGLIGTQCPRQTRSR